MGEFNYTPDKDMAVHEKGAVKLICMSFQSHENGLPEWLKNSADAYARKDASEVKRIIVVVFSSGRGKKQASISCLDFVGMTSSVIEKNFRIWADPEAALQGMKTADIQGGHGNGGKCYMTQMFDAYSMIHTVYGEKGNCYGVKGGSIKLGYSPDREKGRDFSITDINSELTKVLRRNSCRIEILPEAVKDALCHASGFTLVTGVGPKGYGSRIPVRQLVHNLQEHPQMMRTLELCKIYVIVDGKPFNYGKPLILPEIEPIKGEDEPLKIEIPETLKDPVSGTKISTTESNQFQLGTLVLRTSKVNMRWSKKGRHNVVFKAKSGYIGYVPVRELDIQSSYRDRIYGECILDSIEKYKKNERARLANAPLVRAIEAFISEQIQLYGTRLETRDRRQYDLKAKNAVSKMNEALDQWKNRFLNEMLQGLWGPGGGGSLPPPPPLPSGKPARIELILSHRMSGLGVSFRPKLKFFDKGGKRIRSIPYRWVSEDNNVAMVDADLSIINTFAYGQTNIYAETHDHKICTNKVPLEVVHIRDIKLKPKNIQVAVGSRQRIEAICFLDNGVETNDVYLVWTEGNPNIARISAAGHIFGFTQGVTEVVAGDDCCLSKEATVVEVVPGIGKRGYPKILVSGEFDYDPDTKEYRHFSSEDPPVCQHPRDVDRNMWWINSAAPLAQLYLNESKEYGYRSREWRMYHLERVVEIIVQIALTHSPEGKDSLSVDDWIGKWGIHAAEIQAAAVSDLDQFIATGELPKN